MHAVPANAAIREQSDAAQPFASQSRDGWLVDGHVHLHSCYDVARFLAAARQNTTAAARPLGALRATPCLLLTEAAGQHRFDELRTRGDVDGWRFSPTDEPESLLARRTEEGELVIVAGRQIATREKLEVLALGTRAQFDEGKPVVETLRAVQGSGALAAIPWGFGKWWFSRGALVQRLVEAAAPGELFLGDNRSRPRSFGPSRVFRRAAARGIGILPGSDPLPLPSGLDHVGRYGFWLPVPPNWRTPMAQLADVLRSGIIPVISFGERESLPGSLLTQARLRLHRRKGRA
jgi:hypothetical protein